VDLQVEPERVAMYLGGSVVLIRLALFSFEIIVKTFAHCGPASPGLRSALQNHFGVTTKNHRRLIHERVHASLPPVTHGGHNVGSTYRLADFVA
jgi:hypothetical protein